MRPIIHFILNNRPFVYRYTSWRYLWTNSNLSKNNYISVFNPWKPLLLSSSSILKETLPEEENIFLGIRCWMLFCSRPVPWKMSSLPCLDIHWMPQRSLPLFRPGIRFARMPFIHCSKDSTQKRMRRFYIRAFDYWQSMALYCLSVMPYKIKKRPSWNKIKPMFLFLLTISIQAMIF